MVGNLLNVKPICEVKDGLVTQLGQVRGKKNVINKLIFNFVLYSISYMSN